jgi:uncharacterized repeat protein (TIGR03803 family)
MAVGQSAKATTFSVLWNFTGAGDGGNPNGGVIRDAIGFTYGTTSSGGFGYGTVFKLNPSGTLNVLYSFSGGADGADPYGGLVRDAAGNLYGTTPSGGNFTSACNFGGNDGCGVVFKVRPDGIESVLYAFTRTGGDGAFPTAGLVLDGAGNLYGTTQSGGGAFDAGTVFRVDKNGREKVLHSFTGTRGDGARPLAGLVRDAAGNLYGTTVNGGGPANYGTVFMVDKRGKEKVLYRFGASGLHGANPFGTLVRDKKGNLYGTTLYGGASYGTVFKLASTGKQTVLHYFGGADGANPVGGVIRDAKGNLYGTTQVGGASGNGIIFKLGPSGKETVLHNFGGADGAYPNAALLRDVLGNLYGTAGGGGADGFGVVFNLTH